MLQQYYSLRTVIQTLLFVFVFGLPMNRVMARDLVIEEVVVTARKRQETLQEVPDAVTVFTSNMIENTGIEHIGDFMNLTPNLNFQDGSAFRSGFYFISMRGISNGQQGWAPVTFVVDGVRAGSLDSINSGGMIDVERIEVLRGPQSALYGAGAIAGAINVTTKQPTDDLEFKAKAGYGRGDDKKFSVMASGAIIPEKLRYRVNASYRDWDGLIDSASNGIDLDFEEELQFDGQLIFMPADTLSLDFRLHYVNEENGSTYQDKLASIAELNVVNDSNIARRGFAGDDDREFIKFSAKLEWELPLADFISVTGYSDAEQHLLSSVCWDDPDNPGVDVDPLTPGVQVGCLFTPFGGTVGSAAAPGQSIDEFFDSRDDFETFTHDMRFVSTGDTRLRWLAGAEFMDRQTLNGFDAGFIVAPGESFVTLFPQWDVREDFWWGVYGQLSYDLTEQIEVTFVGRYDEVENENTTVSDRDKTAIVQRLDSTGTLVDTVKEKDSAFQPKVQVSYKWSDDISLYFSWSEGFRSGFFNSGNFTLAEDTTNFEGGVKTRLLDGRLIANFTAFHIDYSDQQFSTNSSTPPFRFAVTIPESDIDGVEFESTFRATDALTLSAGLGYLDAEQVTGVRSPLTPEWTANLQADFVHPLINDWDLKLNATYRYQSPQFLEVGEQFKIDPTHFLNLRAGVANEHWNATFWVRNATNERTALAQIVVASGGFIRYRNRPVSYGIEVGYNF